MVTEITLAPDRSRATERAGRPSGVHFGVGGLQFIHRVPRVRALSILACLLVPLFLFFSGSVSHAVSGAARTNILVTDHDAFGGGGGVIRVDPSTGAQTTVSSGGNFVQPVAIRLTPTGDILVADHEAFGSGGIIRVDPSTGAQTVVSSGGFFVDPAGIAISPSGQILVADFSAFGGAIIRVDPSTGTQTVVASGGSLVRPARIALDPSGDMFVVNHTGGGNVIRVDKSTGAQTTVCSGLSFPLGIALTKTRDIFIADLAGAVVRCDPSTGAITTVSSGGSLVVPHGIAVDQAGDILVTSTFAAAIIRVDPSTGAQTVVSSGGSLVHPNGITLEHGRWWGQGG